MVQAAGDIPEAIYMTSETLGDETHDCYTCFVLVPARAHSFTEIKCARQCCAKMSVFDAALPVCEITTGAVRWRRSC